MSWKEKSDLFREVQGYDLEVAVGRPNATELDQERIIGRVDDVHDGKKTVSIDTGRGQVTLGDGDVGRIEIVMPEIPKKRRG